MAAIIYVEVVDNPIKSERNFQVFDLRQQKSWNANKTKWSKNGWWWTHWIKNIQYFHELITFIRSSICLDYLYMGSAEVIIRSWVRIFLSLGTLLRQQSVHKMVPTGVASLRKIIWRNQSGLQAGSESETFWLGVIHSTTWAITTAPRVPTRHSELQRNI